MMLFQEESLFEHLLSSLVLHWSSLVLHWSSLVLHWSSLVLHWSSLVLHWSSFVMELMSKSDSKFRYLLLLSMKSLMSMIIQYL
jgi:hypothetical protein